MKYIFGTFAAFVSLLLIVQPAAASEPIGKVLNAKTAVYSSGGGGKKTLSARDPIFFMDRLSTNGTGVGEFIFDDGTKLAIGPSATLVVDKFVQKGESSFQKLGVNATKGTFRWISGRSPSAAYQIKTPMGTMGIRGTAFDVVFKNGITHVVLLNGAASFCAFGTCRQLKRTGDYISANGRTISETVRINKAFKSRSDAAAVFRFLGNPGMLSSKFRVRGSNLLVNLSFDSPGRSGMNGPARSMTRDSAVVGGGVDDSGNCGGGNCGVGNGGGGGNGTSPEGRNK